MIEFVYFKFVNVLLVRSVVETQDRNNFVVIDLDKYGIKNK
ncbi:hypothetical protein [Neobacillus drentensis]